MNQRLFSTLSPFFIVICIVALFSYKTNAESLVAEISENRAQLPTGEMVNVAPSPREARSFAPLFEEILIGTHLRWSGSVAWGDVDGDGDLDLAVGNDGDLNELWLNDGTGLLTEITGNPLGSYTRSGSNLAWGDIDGDGDLDLAVGNSGVNELWLNDGTGLLTEITGDPLGSYTRSGSNLAWGDIDGDGDLDLAVGNSGVNELWLNDGTGLLTEITGNPLGSYTRSGSKLAWGDIDGDGDLDLAVGNWGVNELWLNDGNGLLTEVAGNPLGSYTRMSDSLVLGDMDGDGDLDLAIGNSGNPNELWLNDGIGSLTEVAGNPLGSFGGSRLVLGDVDGDGDLDFAVGSIGVNELWLNDGNGLFSKVAGNPLGNDWRSTYSLAWGDVDGDGDLDLAVGNGADEFSRVNVLWLNDSNIAFSEVASNPLGTSTLSSYSLSWGDVDSDGDLDLAVGNDGLNELWLNDGAGLFSEVAGNPLGTYTRRSNNLALGDVDGDGDLDLAVGNDSDVNELWLNDGNGLFTEVLGNPLGIYTFSTKNLAWGDVDGDGDLDLAVGNWGVNELWLNDGNGLLTEVPGNPLGIYSRNSYIAWGDIDGDGDLDLAVGNAFDVNELWENDGSGSFNEVIGNPFGTSSHWTRNLAWGDMDGDGDLDLAIGNDGLNELWLNDGNGLFHEVVGSPLGTYTRWSILAWGDVDGDGDLDLAVGNLFNINNELWLNDGTGEFNQAAGNPLGTYGETYSFAWGDMDGDGDLDLAVGSNNSNINRLWKNKSHHPVDNGVFHYDAAIEQPYDLPVANFYPYADMITDRIIPFTYTLPYQNGNRSYALIAEYSINGGGKWETAVLTNTVVSNIIGQQPLYWDTFASGFFGQSDNIVFRIGVTQQDPTPEIGATYQFTNAAPFPLQYAVSHAQTAPFRVRGSQIRVYTDTVTPGNEVGNAVVYRLPNGAVNEAALIGNGNGRPWLTRADGYLPGYGKLGLGDQLLAMVPITSTGSYTLYFTSGTVLTNGLQMDSVTQPGVQNLVVSAANPLLLFDIDISLEWDARNDVGFMHDLNTALRRSSDLLYDVTNGQAVLGKINIYHNKMNWHTADLVIYARNNYHPSANLGGIVTVDTHDQVSATKTITNAYSPGQVRMGPLWDPFGQNESDLTDMWWKALTHELGHYLFYLPDNYLGFANGSLIATDCQGSFMTNAHDDAYTEFLPPSDWAAPCDQTIAEYTTERSDWETVTQYYPWLNGAGGNLGPTVQPLSLPQIQASTQPAGSTIPSRIFDLRDLESGQLLVAPKADHYLIKTNNTPTDYTDDGIILLGRSSGGGDRIKVRGSEVGDRLCSIDHSQLNAWIGCAFLDGNSSNSYLESVPVWQPHITVTPISSKTMMVTVTQYISPANLNVQLLPLYGLPGQAGVFTSTWGVMSVVDPANPVTFSTVLTVPYPMFDGAVRVWVPGSSPAQELISTFKLTFAAWAGPSQVWGGPSQVWGGPSQVWGGPSQVWGGPSQVWGGNSRSWGAPVVSGDGNVTVLNVDDPFAETGVSSMQGMSSLPNLPIWLTPIGQVYNIKMHQGFTQTVNRTIAFDYLERTVPAGYESTLKIYYSTDNGVSWERLATSLDVEDNRASATMGDSADGIYGLMAVVDVAPFNAGWNNFGYPIMGTRPVTTALKSIETKYTSIYNYNAFGDIWYLYDVTVLPAFDLAVNTLRQVEFTKGYWITVTEPVTLYLGVPSTNKQPPVTEDLQPMMSSQFPPTTFYGWVTPTATFTPTVGMEVTAWIGGVACGNSTIQIIDGKLAYTMQVEAENLWGAPNNCGVNGVNIIFTIDSWTMDHDHAWNNAQAWFHPLTNTICAAPPDAGDITIADAGADAAFSWVPFADSYEIYRSTTPYFTADEFAYDVAAGPSYTETAVLGAPVESYYYQIIGVNGCGTSSSSSNETGLFEFGIVPGS